MFTRLAGILSLVLLCGYALAETPVIFWSSSPVQPGETVVVFGHAFAQAQIRVASLAGENSEELITAAAKQDWNTAASTEILQQSAECVKFLLPATIPVGPAVFQLLTAEGNVEGHLNWPQISWVQGDMGHRATPGGWLRVFGVCLPEASLNFQAKLVPVNETGQADKSAMFNLNADKHDAWTAEFKLPEKITPGDYLLQVGAATTPIKIIARDEWPQKIFNVKDFGASGVGLLDDGIAVKNALKAAADNGGGIIYFPRGQYQMSETLQLPARTVLRGAGQALVSIFWPEMAPLPEGQIVGASHFALEDLTLYCSDYTHVVVSDQERTAGGNVRLERVRIRANIYRGHLTQEEVAKRFEMFMKQSTGGGDTVRLGGPNIVIRNCDLYGAGRSISLRQVDGGIIEGNRIYQGRWGWYSFDGCDGLVFADNDMQGADLMSTGGGLNCLSSSYSRNVYYARNNLRLMHGWDREAMTTDAGGSAYFGPMESCVGVTMTLVDETDWSRGYMGSAVFILGGRGMGQYRRITGYEGQTVTLERPWDVEPDTESVISITMLHENYLFIDNNFEDAGIALQYYGTSVNNIASGNRAVRSGGFHNSGMNYYGFQPSWYCQWLENEIAEGNSYRFGPDNATGAGGSFLASRGMQREPNTAPLNICSIIRRNRLLNNARIEFAGLNSEAPGLRDGLAEGNIIEHTEVGIVQDAGVRDVLIRNNSFTDVRYETLDPAGMARVRAEELKDFLGKPDPIIYWNFEDASIQQIANQQQPRFTAMGLSEVELGEGYRGNGLKLNGKGYCIVGGSEILDLPMMTINAWVNPDSIQGRWGILAKRTVGVVSPYVIAITNGGIEVDATDMNGKWVVLNSEPVIQAGIWQMLTVTFDDENGTKIYVDGMLVFEQTDRIGPRMANTMPITIGYEAWGGNSVSSDESGNFVGGIDEVKLWGRALNGEEIQTLYEQEK